MRLFILIFLVTVLHTCALGGIVRNDEIPFIPGKKTSLDRHSSFYSEILPRFMELRGLKNKCDANTTLKIGRFLREDTCQPRPTMVEVDGDISAIIIPHNVLLRRCMGGTSNKQHGCIPTKTKEVKIPVAKLLLNNVNGNFQPECDEIKMIDHVTCALGCKFKAEDCNENQVFVKEHCRCECSNNVEREKCERTNKMWIDGMCSCECLPSTQVDCSTGFMFDNQVCKCVPIPEVKRNKHRYTNF